MKIKNEFFICSITDNSIKVAKCLSIDNVRREFTDLDTETISSDSDDIKINRQYL